ncbi:hypothetical protein BUALT_Bualt01G0237800 [Buddleja alternifolia]|uniref:F-box domain-containing protein n=1 Tax=Buddleja alternifolia TaxID=168488 RepID=A0AAV6YHB1_9LAMI|nr:hypothetical protein BUALT_Bualt01G0237800 [Buddleja alternifolia]
MTTNSTDPFTKLPQDVIFQILTKVPTQSLLHLRCIDFKVVEILYDCDRDSDLMPRAFVYALKIGSWRSIDLVVPCYMPKNWSSSVFVNGIVHWLAYKRPEFNSLPNCIMGFDVVEEGFKLIELPPNLGTNCRELRLSPLVDEKSLALFVSYRENVGETWEVWLMNDYGKIESWSRKYVVVLEQVFIPLKIVNCGEILAAISDEKLVLIDVEKEEIKDLAICGLPLSFYTAGYIPSLALLDVGDQLVQ